MQDPYFLVKGEVDGCLKRAIGCRDRVENGDERALSVMDSALVSADATLTELASAVDIMKKDPSRFQLRPEDVDKRVGEIRILRMEHQKLKDWYAEKQQVARANANKERERKQADLRMRKQIDIDAENGIDPQRRAETDDYFNNNSQQHQELIDRQDEDLEDIGNVVMNIGQMGRQIGEELENQGKLLDELEDDVDRTGSRLENLNKKV